MSGKFKIRLVTAKVSIPVCTLVFFSVSDPNAPKNTTKKKIKLTFLLFFI